MKKDKNLTKDFVLLGQKNIWLPYTQMKNHLPQLKVKNASGSKIFLENGKVLIDGISSWWSVAHGYNHPYLIKEIGKQLKKLPHIMLAGFSNEQTYKLAYRICKFSNMDHVFFSDSGSVAVEVAMKIAWQFYINSNQKEKKKFISFKNSYHGDTVGAMSLADLNSGMHKKFQKHLIENFCFDLTENNLDFLNSFCKKNHDSIAGIFIEPMVQCAGGMIFYDEKILKKIDQIAKANNILLIVDECAVGFYRTKKKFAFEHAEIKPDILILGKALTGGIMTLAATLTNKKIFQSFLGDSLDLALMHGPTFTGNPLACSAANASLDIFEKVNYQEKIADDEIFLKKELEKCYDNPRVKEVNVLGLIVAIKIEMSLKEIFLLRKKVIEFGVFLRPFANVIYVMPPLNIKRNELKKITNAIYQCLSFLK
jgi:adenosylmethionine-8-amino-7-oxononanoate aminotransferase